MLIAERLSATAGRFPAREAVVHGDQRLSWSALDGLASRIAGGLSDIGVQPRDFVAIQLPNSPAYLAALYGILRLGATAVPLNPRYQPDEFAHILADCGAVATIAYAPLAPALTALQTKLPQLRHILLADLSPLTDGGASATGAAPAGGTVPFESWLRGLTPRARDADTPPPVGDDAPATCLYTAGTTGRPKGALLTHRGLLWNIDHLLQVFSADERDRFLCVLPMFHSYAQMACVISTLTLGATLVSQAQFRPATVLETIVRERITIFPGVPAYYGAMLAAARPDEPADLGVLRLAVTGGAAMPPAVVEALQRRYGVTVLEGNGPTEAGPVAYCNPEHGVRKPGSVGQPIPGVAVRVVDDQDGDVPMGAVGEVLVRGPNVMAGYLGQPEATAQALRGGWLHTGDLGRLDADGYLFLVDRKTDLIIVGGLNVYPREVEETLLGHPSVAEAAVVGVPDPLRGEQVVAFVVLVPGQAASPHDLIRYCREHLATYKCPRHLLLRDALEKNAAGKVGKLELRVLAQQDLAMLGGPAEPGGE